MIDKPLLDRLVDEAAESRENERHVMEILHALNPVVSEHPLGSVVEAMARFLVMSHIAAFDTLEKATAAHRDLFLDSAEDIAANYARVKPRVSEMMAQAV